MRERVERHMTEVYEGSVLGILVVYMLSNLEPDLHDLIITTFNKNDNQLYSLKIKLHLGWRVVFPLSFLELGNRIDHDSILARLESEVVCTRHVLRRCDSLPICRNTDFPVAAHLQL